MRLAVGVHMPQARLNSFHGPVVGRSLSPQGSSTELVSSPSSLSISTLLFTVLERKVLSPSFLLILLHSTIEKENRTVTKAYRNVYCLISEYRRDFCK